MSVRVCAACVWVRACVRVCVCVCVCACVFYGLWITYSSRVLLAAGALREDRSALYPYMAYHGASPYLRRSTH